MRGIARAEPSESQEQARCMRVARAMLGMCFRILFVFPSCSLRILLVFLAFSPGAARVALPRPNGIAAVALSASDGATTAMFGLDQARMEPFALHAGTASVGGAACHYHRS